MFVVFFQSWKKGSSLVFRAIRLGAILWLIIVIANIISGVLLTKESH